ncbi:hypothetical protein [Bdellovibrio sp. HCB274]|uniref:hypothetical protein n=1 Tax=Bdellovibrio sp. HCB274 TaxID=3394361 RepID=UPI0039B3F20F
MNIKHLVTFFVIFSFVGLGPALAEDVATPPPADASEVPVTGYQGMLPYIQENAAIRKEAQKKYGSKKSSKKNKKSKSKSAKSKKKSGKKTSKKSKAQKKQ